MAKTDFSIQIDKFARKAQALFNKIAKERKLYVRCSGSEYGDAAARLYLENDRVDTTTLLIFDNAVRELVEDYRPIYETGLLINNVSVGGWEINIDFI